MYKKKIYLLSLLGIVAWYLEWGKKTLHFCSLLCKWRSFLLFTQWHALFMYYFWFVSIFFLFIETVRYCFHRILSVANICCHSKKYKNNYICGLSLFPHRRIKRKLKYWLHTLLCVMVSPKSEQKKTCKTEIALLNPKADPQTRKIRVHKIKRVKRIIKNSWY